MQVSTNQNSHNKYILMTGAPGSKWSSVAYDIRDCPEMDTTDSSPKREYQSPNQGGPAKHVGAYWDPGMEFDNLRPCWDIPFSGNGVRVIKSHTFAHDLEYLGYEGYPIVMVYRNDVECFNHWVAAGGFDITYPNYKPYYKNLDTMYNKIVWQNRDIMDFVHKNKRVKRVQTKSGLCNLLGLTMVGKDLSYKDRDVTIYVYQ